jgi:predicted transcriptional regulator
MARRHLAIFLKGVAERVLSGQKKVEIRLAQNRIAPYLQVQKSDEIYLKNSGGKIIGQAVVDNVLFYEISNPITLTKLRENYREEAAMDENFWDAHRNSRFATVIFLKNPTKFLTPVIFKKHDRRPWVVMEEEK